MGENTRPHRLYLAKGDSEDKNIYVDTISLPQHQYDGIRFLYRQYIKGKAGVILNDPPGYGKRVQTALFLNAMHSVASQPTLILCQEGMQDVWVQQFRQWTSMFVGSDVIVQKGHEYAKAMCVIASISQSHWLCRREWGIVVVDDHNVSRDVLRSDIVAKYKIWLTSFDMKKYTHLFSSIYKWMYPRDKYVIEEIPPIMKPAVLLDKTTRLDAFMQDVVIRRRDVMLPLGYVCRSPERQRVSRKNKDATGKKIKRSKPKIDVTITDSQETNSENLTNVREKKNGEVTEKKEDTENSFVVNIQSEEIKIDQNNSEDKMSDTSNPINNSESIVKLEDDQQEKSDDTNIDFNPEDKVSSRNSPKPDTEQDSYNILFNTDIIDSQKITIKYDSESQDCAVAPEIPAKKSRISDETNSDNTFRESDNKSEPVIDHDTEATTTSEVILENSSDLFSETLPISEVKDKIIMDNVKCVNEGELVNKNNVSENNKTDPQLSGVDLKIKQMEELAMKKFKGSFLDRMLN